ncbi:MAG: hypothetical protein F6K36_30445 [Symploca sp. SIO3C6]|nr:hypothetical protein [Symploca sp. SIO3C6]
MVKRRNRLAKPPRALVADDVINEFIEADGIDPEAIPERSPSPVSEAQPEPRPEPEPEPEEPKPKRKKQGKRSSKEHDRLTVLIRKDTIIKLKQYVLTVDKMDMSDVVQEILDDYLGKLD